MKFYLVLDNIRSAQNVGSIIRTAEGAGVDKIFLSGITPQATSEKVIKTALGAEKFVKIEYVSSTHELIDRLRADGFSIVSLEITTESKNYDEVDYRLPLCLIVGNEVTGIKKEILDLSDYVIQIPMRGKKNSLNVSVVAGIAVYEISKKIK